MGQPYQLWKMSKQTGKPVDALIDEALASSTSRTEAAFKLNISTQALATHLSRRERRLIEQREAERLAAGGK